MCQDTGAPFVYLTIPPDISLTEDLMIQLHRVSESNQVSSVTSECVDPLTRHNSGDNTGLGMRAIHIKPGKAFTVTGLPKGAEAENSSRIAMLLPYSPVRDRRVCC